MTRTIQAVYEKGLLRPLERIEELADQVLVKVTVEVEQERLSEKDPILEVIGICCGGPEDGAEQHDHYIYGSPKRWSLSAPMSVVR